MRLLIYYFHFIFTEQALQENEVFLCCSVQRNRFTSGGGISPPAYSPGAQWFIVSRKRYFKSSINDK